MFLEHVVNLTDFIKFSTLLKMFELDKFDYCLEKLRKESSVGLMYMREENLSRLRESINAKHLSKDLAKK